MRKILALQKLIPQVAIDLALGHSCTTSLAHCCKYENVR